MLDNDEMLLCSRGNPDRDTRHCMLCVVGPSHQRYSILPVLPFIQGDERFNLERLGRCPLTPITHPCWKNVTSP